MQRFSVYICNNVYIHYLMQKKDKMIAFILKWLIKTMGLIYQSGYEEIYV